MFCFLHTAAELQLYLDFFPLLLEGEESCYSSITNSDMKMKVFIYFCYRGWVHDPACIAISGKAPITFNENWVVLLLGTGDAMISLICDSSKSVQSQGIEKQPTKKRKSILEKHPAIISVGLVIILGEVNNGSGLWKHAVISKKYQIVGKFFPEGTLSFENNSSKQIQQTHSSLTRHVRFLKHKMGGVWIWFSPV